MVKSYKLILLIVFGIIFLTVFIVSTGNALDSAFAQEIISEAVLTSTRIKDINSEGTITYLYDVAYESGYAKDVKATFDVTADYYSFEYSIDNGDIVAEAIQQTPNSGKVVFSADTTGIYNLTCYAYADENGSTQVGKASTIFRNDVDAPNLPEIKEMDTWQQVGVAFDVNVEWSSCTDVSGIYEKAYYFLEYGNGLIEPAWKEISIQSSDVTTITITNNCEITLLCYDNSGNYAQKTIAFDKFDGISPPQPTYTITPTLTETSMAKNYTITVNYPNDAQSGLKSEQYYLLNGQSYLYDGSIIIGENPANYNLRLYSVDNAGNRSEYVDITIKNTNFDLLSPTIDNLSYTIDVTEMDNMCTLSFAGNDSGGSGIKSAYIVELDKYLSKFILGNDEIYTIKFNCLNYYTLTIHVTDYAGNVAVQQVLINHFSDVDVNNAVSDIITQFSQATQSDYNVDTWGSITSSISMLNMALEMEGKTKNEILIVCEEISKLLKSDLVVDYKIKSIPEIASSMINFIVDGNELTNGYKKGDVVTFELLSANVDEIKETQAKNLAGIKDSFCTAFDINVIFSGVEINQDVGLNAKAIMNLPPDYLNREFVLINLTDNVKVDGVISNNKMEFAIEKSTDYVLVISGGKAVSGTKEENKTITVLGNVISLPKFLGIVCGIGCALIIVVVVLVVLMIKRRK